MTTIHEHALALEEYKSLRQEVLERLARVSKYHHGLLLGTAYYALSLVPALGEVAVQHPAGAVVQSLVFVLPFLALAIDIACVSELDGILRAGIYIRDHIERVWKHGQYEGWETWLTAQDLTHRRRTSDRLLDKARRGIVLLYCVLSALILGQLLSSPTGLIDAVRGSNPWVLSAAFLFSYLIAASLSFVFLENRRRQEFSRAKYDVFVLDVDGCLLNSSQQITDANRRALRDIQDSGVSIVLASGRSTASLAAIAADAGLMGWHIASHGASLLQITATKVRTETRAGLKPAQARLIAARLTALFPDTLWVAIQADGDHYTDGVRIDAVRQLLVSRRDLSEDQAKNRLFDIAKVPSEDDEPFEKILLYLDRTKSIDSRVRGELQSMGCQVLRTTQQTLEIVAGAASKVESAKTVLAKTDKMGASVLTCGDHDNDISLLRWGNMNVAPRNAVQRVKDLPRVVSLQQSNDEDLIAVIARLYFGIQANWGGDAEGREHG